MSEQHRTEMDQATSITPNQIVAFRLQLARRMAELTQDEAAELLEPYLGTRWSKASFSAAERSAVGGERVRRFSADEIVAFAMAFELPVTWFFLPPSMDLKGAPTLIETPDVPEDMTGHIPGYFLDVIFGYGDGEEAVRQEIQEVLRHAPADWLSARQQQIARWTRTVTRAIVRESVEGLADWSENLRRLADRLEAAQEMVPDRVVSIHRELMGESEEDEG